MDARGLFGRNVRRWRPRGPRGYRILLLLAGFLGTPVWGATAQRPVLEEFMRCPDLSSTMMSLAPDGQATLVVLRGDELRTMRSFTNRKRLTAADMQDLLALLRGSGFARLPEAPDATPGPDTCLIHLEIRLDGREATLRYQSEPEPVTPAKALARKIHAILDRHAWRE
jgi:hypothetical protein